MSQGNSKLTLLRSSDNYISTLALHSIYYDLSSLVANMVDVVLVWFSIGLCVLHSRIHDYIACYIVD